jgi:hypothetical protein
MHFDLCLRPGRVVLTEKRADFEAYHAPADAAWRFLQGRISGMGASGSECEARVGEAACIAPSRVRHTNDALRRLRVAARNRHEIERPIDARSPPSRLRVDAREPNPRASAARVTSYAIASETHDRVRDGIARERSEHRRSSSTIPAATSCSRASSLLPSR